jgi:hypothetical protein
VSRRPAIAGAALFVLGGALGYSQTQSAVGRSGREARPAEARSDTLAASRAAFLAVYAVLMSPRCMNCHPAGNAPLQGDDSHIHAQGVKRGADGKGLYALKCAACHQEANLPGLNMPPGNPRWHLPAAVMPLVFQGLSPRELALQLKDPRRNGGKTLDQLVEHVSHDGLVLGAWKPGEGRTLPPFPHAEFAARFKEWVDKGAAVPE